MPRRGTARHPLLVTMETRHCPITSNRLSPRSSPCGSSPDAPPASGGSSRLLLGNGAYDGVMAKLTELQQGFEAWEAVSRSADYPKDAADPAT